MWLALHVYLAGLSIGEGRQVKKGYFHCRMTLREGKK